MGNGNNDGEVCPSIPPILLQPMACCIAFACWLKSAACCGVNCPLLCFAFTRFKKALSWLQAGVSWLRFNCATVAFNGASKLVVTPFGRLKLSIVLIRFCIASCAVVAEITETEFESIFATYTLLLTESYAIPFGALPTGIVYITFNVPASITETEPAGSTLFVT